MQERGACPGNSTMDAMTNLIAYGATAVVFLALDLVWLGAVANSFYRSELEPLMREQVNIPVAAGFYALYVLGLVIFSVAPALAAGSWRTALVYGALFGFFAYATYDLTNLATLRHWPVALTLVDLLWGTALSGMSATLGYLITVRLA
jgi:uncharacterized membrane protein